jgi:hypothetical protein
MAVESVGVCFPVGKFVRDARELSKDTRPALKCG